MLGDILLLNEHFIACPTDSDQEKHLPGNLNMFSSFVKRSKKMWAQPLWKDSLKRKPPEDLLLRPAARQNKSLFSQTYLAWSIISGNAVNNHINHLHIGFHKAPRTATVCSRPGDQKTVVILGAVFFLTPKKATLASRKDCFFPVASSIVWSHAAAEAHDDLDSNPSSDASTTPHVASQHEAEAPKQHLQITAICKSSAWLSKCWAMFFCLELSPSDGSGVTGQLEGCFYGLALTFCGQQKLKLSSWIHWSCDDYLSSVRITYCKSPSAKSAASRHICFIEVFEFSGQIQLGGEGIHCHTLEGWNRISQDLPVMEQWTRPTRPANRSNQLTN